MKVTVIGLGYVGSVAAAGFASADHEVLGIDVDEKRVEAMNRGVAPIYEPGLSDIIHRSIKSGNLRFATTSEANEQLGDVVIIATGTPMSESGAADLSQVYSAIDWAKGRMSDGDVVVMKSTVPPGTGARLKDLLKNGTTISYVSNPEFLREGQAIDDWFNPDRIVVGGDDAAAVSKVSSLYENMTAPIVKTDITSAEMIKYAANAFLAAKISFINEIAALCDRVGGTIDDVTKGISLDPRIGPSFLRPGVGYGGSCFPKDVRALDHLAMANGHSFELLRSVIAVNSRQRLLPLNVMRERFGRLDGVKVGVMGLAFKPNTD
ncbi:MAG: UDP-glucose/GDP-mannose dehydrogenase family protein, partial [Chloroflexi bacterium]|nr:UDP-glucose/GDP-mannose dehydrogenase family protein [Chloroflexota bacterium]